MVMMAVLEVAGLVIFGAAVMTGMADGGENSTESGVKQGHGYVVAQWLFIGGIM